MDLGCPKTRADAENILALVKRYTVYGLALKIRRPRPTVQNWHNKALAMVEPGYEAGEPAYDPVALERPVEAPVVAEKPRYRVRAGSSRHEYAGRPYCVAYWTDAHNMPQMPLDRFEWLARFVDDVGPDMLLDGGDGDDFLGLCSHERNDTWKGKLKPSLLRDLEAAGEMRQLLDRKITHKCPKIITLGNHEARLWTYSDQNPEIHGIPEKMYTDMLDLYGWRWHKFGEYVNIEGIDAVHVPLQTTGKPIGGDTASKGVADKSLRDVVWGHTHRYDIYAASKFGPARSVISFNGGCFMPSGYMGSYAQNTRKEYWRGAHILSIADGRLKSWKSYTMEELQALYS